MLSKRKELHFKVNSVVESTLIHCREKKQRGRRGKRKSFFKKWQVYAWALLVFFVKEVVQPSTWRGTDIEKKVRHRFKDTSIWQR